MINNMYMQSNRRKQRNNDYIRTYAPYVATALLVLVLFWGVDSIKQDTQRRQYDPAELVQAPVAPPRDWTHKLSTAAPYDDKHRPDDDTALSCPLPSGNWGHTCDREVSIEGPCNGKCMLKALCHDVKDKFKETTFEYGEGRRLEIKNVNGLLCSIEDGSPSCGLNFHGNLALKNCQQGYIPRRHEIIIDGLYADAKVEKKDDQRNAWDDKDPDDYDENRFKKKNKAHDDDEGDQGFDIRRPKRKRWEEDDHDDHVEEHHRKFGGGHHADADEDTTDARPAKKTFEEHDEYRPVAPKRAPLPPKHEGEPDRRGYRHNTDDDVVEDHRRRGAIAGPTGGRGAAAPDGDTDDFGGDEDRMLRGERRNREMAARYDDDDRPPRRRRNFDDA